jgi:uncharacterized protein (TIGR03086 family)
VYAGHRLLDVFVHGWDLAVATGQDPALDPGLIQACRDVIEPDVAAFRAAGALGDEQPVPPDATDQQRFLAMLGRRG